MNPGRFRRPWRPQPEEEEEEEEEDDEGPLRPTIRSTSRNECGGVAEALWQRVDVNRIIRQQTRVFMEIRNLRPFYLIINRRKHVYKTMVIPWIRPSVRRSIDSHFSALKTRLISYLCPICRR